MEVKKEDLASAAKDVLDERNAAAVSRQVKEFKRKFGELLCIQASHEASLKATRENVARYEDLIAKMQVRINQALNGDDAAFEPSKSEAVQMNLHPPVPVGFIGFPGSKDFRVRKPWEN